MLHTELAFRRCCLVVLLVLSLIAMAAVVDIIRQGVRIDTNLKNLSPSLTQEPAINNALDKMSAQAAQQFLLVLVSPSFDAVENATDELREVIDTFNGLIIYPDQGPVMQRYLSLLRAYQFNLLSETARVTLATLSDQEILARARANLYGSASSLRLIPLEEDPLGFVNEYALTVLEKISVGAKNDVTETLIDGQKMFISTHVLQLSVDTLAMNQQGKILDTIKKITTQIHHTHPEVKILQSGVIFFAADAAQAAKQDISVITTCSSLAVLLLVLIVFRNVRALILPISSIFFGTLFAFLVCHLLFGSIHIFTIVFGASLVGVVADYALHFYYFYNKASTAETKLQLYRALLLSLITSVIGYGALALSGLAALTQIALFSALGLIFAWLIIVVIGPGLVKSVFFRDQYLQRALGVVLTQLARVSNFALTALVLMVFLSLSIFIRFEFPTNDSPRAFFVSNSKLLEQEKLVNSLIATHEPASFVVVEAATQQQLFDRIEAVEQRLGPASRLLGVHNFFPSPKTQQINYDLNARLYREGGLVSQFVQENDLGLAVKDLTHAYSSSNHQSISPADFFNEQNTQLPPFWIETENRLYSFLLIPKTTSTETLTYNLAEIDGVSFISVMVEAEQSLRDLRISALQLLGVALGLILLLMLVQYRSMISIALIAVPTLAIGLALLFLAALGIPLTLFHIMALFLVIGLGMDYVIFVAEMTENSAQTLSAVVLSAITSIISFGLLALSSVPAASAFGLTVLVGSSLNLFGALILASRPGRMQLKPVTNL